MDEPRNLDDENPARTFTVSMEIGVFATIIVEYRGGGWWGVDADTGAPGPRKPELFRGWIGSSALRRAQQYAAIIMEEQADKARATCECGTDGQDTSGNGNFACGAMSPHGISVRVYDVHGNDMTDDYGHNGV